MIKILSMKYISLENCTYFILLLSSITISLEIYVKRKLCCQDGSVDEGALPFSNQVWWPGFDLWDPHNERRESTHTICPLVLICSMSIFLQSHTQTNKQTNKGNQKYEMGFFWFKTKYLTGLHSFSGFQGILIFELAIF